MHIYKPWRNDKLVKLRVVYVRQKRCLHGWGGHFYDHPVVRAKNLPIPPQKICFWQKSRCFLVAIATLHATM